MILTTPDVNVVLMDFPSKKGNEMVVPNEDGKNDDFSKDNVQEIEYYAHHLHKDPEPAQIYLDRIKQLQAERRRLKKRIARDQKRVEFIQEHCDMFQRAEHHYLYGDDL